MDIRITAAPGRSALYSRSNTVQSTQKTGASVLLAQDELTISPEARAAAVDAISDAQAGDGATFPAEFSKITQSYTETIRAHYAAEHAENLTYDDPVAHIWDKYKNPDSSCFHAGLSEDERAWAYDQELDLFNGGRHLQMSNPYAFGEPPTLASAATQAMQACRKQTDRSIQVLFAENGIELPADASFRLTVDPSDYTIHVDGLEDEGLVESVEQALNRGGNGKNLYDHLKLTVPDGEELEIDYASGHLAALDTERELDDRTLSEVKKQAGPIWARYSITYDPHQEAMNEKILSLDPDSPLCTRESKDRLSAAVRVGAPEVIAEFRTRQQDLRLIVNENKAVNPDGTFSVDAYAKAYAHFYAQQLLTSLNAGETPSYAVAPYAGNSIDGLEISRAAHSSAVQAVRAALAQPGSALGGLTNLTGLDLNANNISDISALSGLTNLEKLDLRGNNIADYSPVQFVPELHR